MKQAFSILNILFLLLSFMGFMPAAVKAEPLTNNIQIVKLSTAMPSRTEKPMVSAEQSDFNEDTGLYSLKGKVNITFSGRTITANSAKIKEPTLQLWTSVILCLLRASFVLVARPFMPSLPELPLGSSALAARLNGQGLSFGLII